MTKISISGEMNGVYTVVEFASDLEIDKQVNYTGTIEFLTQQLSIAGMKYTHSKNTFGAGIREKTKANGQHPDDYYVWPLKGGGEHTCENCGDVLGLKYIKAFKSGRNIGKPGWMSVHTTLKPHADCHPIFMLKDQFVPTVGSGD